VVENQRQREGWLDHVVAAEAGGAGHQCMREGEGVIPRRTRNASLPQAAFRSASVSGCWGANTPAEVKWRIENHRWPDHRHVTANGRRRSPGGLVGDGNCRIVSGILTVHGQRHTEEHTCGWECSVRLILD
jgi:hypothetical protein